MGFRKGKKKKPNRRKNSPIRQKAPRKPEPIACSEIGWESNDARNGRLKCPKGMAKHESCGKGQKGK